MLTSQCCTLRSEAPCIYADLGCTGGPTRVRLADFGQARIMDVHPPLRGMHGPVAYLSPERLQGVLAEDTAPDATVALELGEGAEASWRDNSFARGTTLLEVLTGKLARPTRPGRKQ